MGKNLLSLLRLELARYLNKGKMIIGLLKKTVAKYSQLEDPTLRKEWTKAVGTETPSNC